MIQAYESGNRKLKDLFYVPKGTQHIGIEQSKAFGPSMETTDCIFKGNCTTFLRSYSVLSVSGLLYTNRTLFWSLCLAW